MPWEIGHPALSSPLRVLTHYCRKCKKDQTQSLPGKEMRASACESRRAMQLVFAVIIRQWVIYAGTQREGLAIWTVGYRNRPIAETLPAFAHAGRAPGRDPARQHFHREKAMPRIH